MDRPAGIGDAVVRHYASKTTDGRVETNKRYGHLAGLDYLRDMAALAKDNPALMAGLSPQDRYKLAQLQLTDANRARKAEQEGDAA
ncbi:hypothetical protein Nocox_36935 [Nonomuraea coxensis DSM 45129]|uniref:Uncharacterized protein n=1 Tax=Nonomuraea coxensis DSM 45129 TaxID=1122611 RepID=A0ABX8UDB6_9ACTN|nr:hypothetical protein [Nonomuraea coxensis]QYC44941.1 hypothetical protein Nocox_36935 [Nonomuraea coxensis DSM 45129]